MTDTNGSRHACTLLVAATTFAAAIAGALAPTGCIPGDAPDIGGMFDCDENDQCCDGGVCREGECEAGGSEPGQCTFNGAILAGASCGCAVRGSGIGGPGGLGGPGTIEPSSDGSSAGPTMREFVADLEAAGFPPGGSAEEAEFFQAGCDSGLVQACVGLAIVHAVKTDSDLEAAALAAQQACELGGPEGCYLLGGAYATGSGVPMDEATAELLFSQSCEMGLELGCEGASSIPQAMEIIEARLEP